MRSVKQRTLTGFATPEVQAYEAEHRAVARKAAAQGFVLLKNEGNVLPLGKDKTIAMYGEGATHTIKGGTGSGDVNCRETVSIWQGLKNAGFTIANEDWLAAYDKQYKENRVIWRETIWQKAEAAGGTLWDFWNAQVSTFIEPVKEVIGDEKLADAAIYVIARNAGEGADRFDKKGDYELTDEEEMMLTKLNNIYSEVVLILNIGGLIDLGFTEKFSNIKAILYIHQPGMEAGNAVADVLTGDVTPSGKLTDSWAMKYGDYPSSDTFSHNNGDVTKELYPEGIFVGYRYFDSYSIPVRYGFGFGLSYTTFDIRTIGITHYDLGTVKPEIGVKVQVTNTGKVSGREVVEIYVSCPQGRMIKEFRRLVGFAKTSELAAGASEELEIRFPLYALASYDGFLPGWVMERGEYILLVGNSLADTKAVGVVRADDELVFTNTENICTPSLPIPEYTPDPSVLEERRDALVSGCELPVIGVHTGDVVTETIEYTPCYEDTPEEVREFVDTLSLDELVNLATGDISKGQGAGEDNDKGESDDTEADEEKKSNGEIGAAGNSVPGSAAQTMALADKGLADIVLADGPAGLRLSSKYPVVNGAPGQMPFICSVEGGFLAEGHVDLGDDLRYQFTTAIPAGTNLAQSWDIETVKECGRVVAEEMDTFGVTLWLAPGMNIHRNPLCGRNFEYYSEDPLVSGIIAAAMTDGVQSIPGCGTTIKHFFCNNSEDNRMGVDCIVSERAIREIYFKGFEITVKKSQPMALMTSYNQINGYHAANDYDSVTKALRCEWGFKGLVMTDWETTTQSTAGESTASGCMRAGNDIVMPGKDSDHKNIREEIASGTLSMADLKRSAARLVNIVWQSSRYDG